MMIVHVPADGAKATLISLPRDSYVDIPGYGKYKLNSAYPDGYNNTAGGARRKRAGGAKVLVNTIQNLTGLTIDHFVQVDLLGFYRISNAIGGVTVNMCAAVKEPDSGINLHEGVNIIKGTQALAFVRQRYGFPNGLGDLDRVERQRYFLTAAFRKLTSAGVLLNPFKLQDLLNAVQSSLYMDTGLDPLALARQMENLSANNIVGQTIPTDGFGNDAASAASVVVNPGAGEGVRATACSEPADTKLSAAKTGRAVARSPSTCSTPARASTAAAAQQRRRAARGRASASARSATPVAQRDDRHPVRQRHAGAGQDARAPTCPAPRCSRSVGRARTLLLGTDGADREGAVASVVDTDAVRRPRRRTTAAKPSTPAASTERRQGDRRPAASTDVSRDD